MGCRCSRYADVVEPPNDDVLVFSTQLEYDLAFVKSPMLNQNGDADTAQQEGDSSIERRMMIATPQRHPTKSILSTPLLTLSWSDAGGWLADQVTVGTRGVREGWNWLAHWETEQRTTVGACASALALLFLLALFVAIEQARQWAFLPGRGGVTLFYDVLMCPPVPATFGGRRFARQEAKTTGWCAGDLSVADVAPPIHRSPSLDVTLRLEDGYTAGKPYLPVVVLGHGQYALITVSAIDALRRPVYAPVTFQLGPDEHYPWPTNMTAAAELAALHEDVVEDIVEVRSPPYRPWTRGMLPAIPPVDAWHAPLHTARGHVACSPHRTSLLRVGRISARTWSRIWLRIWGTSSRRCPTASTCLHHAAVPSPTSTSLHLPPPAAPRMCLLVPLTRALPIPISRPQIQDHIADEVETVAEDLFDSIDGSNATQDVAEEIAEDKEEAAEEAAEEVAEIAETEAEKAAEEVAP